MVKVEREPVDFLPPYEDCCKCNQPTPYWYTSKDVALCPECAEKYDDKDIPHKSEWVNS